MLRIDNCSQQQPSLWETVLPPEIFQMNEELTKVDTLLDDERFFIPFKEGFNVRMGRPTTAVATYLRLMYLKYRYGLGYEVLVKEVSDSLAWRRFCHLSLDDRVPDSTTLIKLTHKYGADTVSSLNDTLVLKLKESKVIRGRKLRIDTTVVESDIHHPTDTGLLNDGIRVITRVVSQLKNVVPGIGGRFVKHTKKAKKVYLGLMKVMKSRAGKDKAALKDAQKKLVKIMGEVIAGGRQVQTELESLQETSPLVNRMRGQMDEWIKSAEKVVRQTQEVIKGNRHLSRRLVSLFDTDARPIKRGKARADTEFGRKVLLGETDHGIITVYDVLDENPSDTTLLKPAVKGHRRLFRKRLKAVAADRGFSSQANEDWLKHTGVKRVSIPKRGKVGEERRRHQKQSWFKRLQRFRAGIEGRISLLKRKFGLRRSRMRGSAGTKTWVGQSIFTQNLWQAARIG
ncbi:MAG: ISNCY family transposase [Dehalococcoidales bacterium]|nr:ISNCY family transposase [Dehalococcoidales bacterium]